MAANLNAAGFVISKGIHLRIVNPDEIPERAR